MRNLGMRRFETDDEDPFCNTFLVDDTAYFISVPSWDACEDGANWGTRCRAGVDPSKRPRPASEPTTSSEKSTATSILTRSKKKKEKQEAKTKAALNFENGGLVGLRNLGNTVRRPCRVTVFEIVTLDSTFFHFRSVFHELSSAMSDENQAIDGLSAGQ